MLKYLKNKLIFCTFFSLFSAGSFALYLANDEPETIEEVEPPARSNQVCLTFEELPEDIYASYEHAIEELIRKDARYGGDVPYREIAKYMAPRLLLWGIAAYASYEGMTGMSPFLGIMHFSRIPFTCTLIEGCCGYLKRLCKGKTSVVPREFHDESKNHFFGINLDTWRYFSWAVELVSYVESGENEFGLLATLSDDVMRLFVRAEIKCEVSTEKIKKKIIQRLKDGQISFPLRLPQSDKVLEVNVEQVVGNKPFFKLNDTNFQVKYDEDQCGICRAEWVQGENIADMLPCLHRFHRDCIQGWLEHQNPCPLCRTNVTAVFVSSLASIEQ